MSDTQNQLDRIMRYANLIQRHAGKAVRPYREDGWVNLLNKYGTSRDTSEQYHFVEEGIVPDEVLSMIYEGNGLFARIIDIPAEEAVKHGFKLKNVNDHCIEDFYMAALDELDWDEVAITSVKWARLFGGSIAVMLINDGRRLEEPVDWRNIKSIDDIRVYDRSVVQPDYDSMYSYDPSYPFGTRGSRLGMPEYYYVNSTYGSFTVHESRCLVFQNGVLPERTSSSIYRLWGMPEYVRIQRAVRDSEVAHGSAVKMLDKSVQPVYKMKDLSMELSTDEGENRVLKRLQSIDTARGMMNTLVVDNDGEDYDFRTFQFAGVADVVNLSDSYLSGLSLIPQTILFGKGVGGLSTTDDTSMENYYNFVDRIRRRMLRPNLRYLLSVIFQAGVATGEVDKVPPINIAFDPLWSLNEIQQADLDLKRAQIRQTNANTSMVYMGQQVISPEEVRKSIAKTGDFEIDATFDDDDMTEEEMNDLIEKIQSNGGLAPSSGGAPEGTPGVPPASEPGGAAPDAAPAATKLPQDMSPEEQAAAQQPPMSQENREYDDENTISHNEEKLGSVGVLVVKDGKVLAGIRIGDGTHGLICGPGGHIEAGETPEFAAARETSEEFGIIPNELIFLGRGEKEPETGFEPYLYLCTDYSGEVKTDEEEMTSAEFISLGDLEKISGQLFAPFAYSLKVLKKELGFRADGKKAPRCQNTDSSEKSIDNAGKQATIKAEDTDATDDKDIKWITVNGTPVPLKDGKAVGGPLAGKAFSKAKSEAPKEKASSPKKVKASSLKNGFGKTNTSESTGNDSLAKYTGADGNLTPEREKLHASIAESHFEGVKKPKGQPTYTFMGGGPAAGKGSIKRLPDAGYLSGADAVELDPDEIKGKLPEYKEMISSGQNKKAAAYVHEESSALSKRISEVATENGYNVSLDGTGDGSVESMRKKIKEARDAGMKVNGVYVTIPVEEAIRRAEARGDKTNRYVPIDRIVSIHRKVSQILPQIAAEFDSVKLYDNSGSEPVLIATGGNGKGLQPIDQKLFDDFINKGK